MIPLINSIYDLIKSLNISSEDKKLYQGVVDDVKGKVSNWPRERFLENARLLEVLTRALFDKAQNLYGLGTDDGLILHELLDFNHDKNHSQIGPHIDDNKKIVIAINCHANTWEEVFYEVSHEVLHLLDPVFDVKNPKNTVSTLEEGVAVKFAEDMYKEYISCYTKDGARLSPNNSIVRENQYRIAFRATNKLPDTVLNSIRGIFGRFSKIDDIEKDRKSVV